jgi:hypothetical protein
MSNQSNLPRRRFFASAIALVAGLLGLRNASGEPQGHEAFYYRERERVMPHLLRAEYEVSVPWIDRAYNYIQQKMPSSDAGWRESDLSMIGRARRQLLEMSLSSDGTAMSECRCLRDRNRLLSVLRVEATYFNAALLDRDLLNDDVRKQHGLPRLTAT